MAKGTLKSKTFAARTFAGDTLASSAVIIGDLIGSSAVTFAFTGDLDGTGELIGLSGLTLTITGAGSLGGITAIGLEYTFRRCRLHYRFRDEL